MSVVRVLAASLTLLRALAAYIDLLGTAITSAAIPLAFLAAARRLGGNRQRPKTRGLAMSGIHRPDLLPAGGSCGCNDSQSQRLGVLKTPERQLARGPKAACRKNEAQASTMQG